jgi:2'-hydroxyisoflavone reductase
VLGGTRFVGRTVVEAAVASGWDVTILHQGTRPAPVGIAEDVIADRTATDGLDALPSRRWDAVVDTWAGDPGIVRRSAGLLRGKVGRYVYVSSRSVYARPTADGADESAPLVEPAAPGEEPSYPQCKRGAEDAVRAAFPNSSLIARAGVLLGPYEHPGRLPWWLGRLARGGDVPVPGPPDFELQYLDARDLADWLLRAIEARRTGAFNAIGPVGGSTMVALMDSCRRATGSTARLRWIDPAIVLESGLAPWPTPGDG